MVEKRPADQSAHEPIAIAAPDREEEIMLALHLPTEPYWLDLPRGIRVEIKPVTTAVMAAAQAAASRRLGAARAEAGDGEIDPDMAITGGVRLSGGSPADAVRLQVFEAASADLASATKLAAEPTSLFWDRTGLPAGTQRWFWLRAVSAEGSDSALAGPVTETASL
jgi:hypothetical protein